MARSVRFGTDGLRGRVGTEIDEELLWAVGVAAAGRLGSPEVVVGRDTRESGAALTAALADGLVAGGARVCDLGVAPTPAVAHVAASRDVAGAVVTASHNPYADNGVKLLGRGGRKLDDRTEEEIAAAASAVTAAREVRTSSVCPDWRADYLSHVVVGVAPGSLRGLTVVLDCANGAHSGLAARAVASLGATVIAVSDEPDGRNINDGCGATAPGALASAVTLRRADVGLAFDGDGDRVLAVDHLGHVVDGDRILALAAIDLAARGMLDGGGVVVTVMTNSGFHEAMRRRGIEVVTTPVGDRSVLDALDRRGFALGGEQSGHLVYRRRATTGDGLLAGIALLDIVRRAGEPLSVLARDAMQALPQVVRNVETVDKHRVEQVLADEVERATAELDGVGRVLLRASGTEPVVRVMVEAADHETATRLADRLATAVRERLDGHR